ncbi:MAG: PepSY domain-containing protein [Pseudomonadota bacterium]
MRFLHAFLALALVATGMTAAPARAIEDPRDQDAALAGAQAGRLVSFNKIRDRVGARVGGKFLGCDCDPNAARYRLRYMRGNEVVEVDVDARTGNILRIR